MPKQFVSLLSSAKGAGTIRIAGKALNVLFNEDIALDVTQGPKA